MLKRSVFIALLFIYAVMALKMSFKPIDLAKELKQEGSLNTLFHDLIYNRTLGSQGFRLLTSLIDSESTDFRSEYLKFCQEFTIFTFLDMISKANRYPFYSKLDWQVLFSADCVSASKVKFGPHEESIITFLNDHNVYPVQAKIFRPSQWSLSTYTRMLTEASFLKLNWDWNSLCADAALEVGHLSQEIWNSHERLWRFLNYSCLSKMEESKRVMLKNTYISVFRSHPLDSREDLAMKIISTLAAFLKLKFGMTAKDMENSREIKTIRAQITDLFSKFTNSEPNEEFSSVLKILIDYFIFDGTLIVHDHNLLCAVIIKNLIDHPNVTSSWMIDLNLVLAQFNSFLLDNLTFIGIIDWFLDKNPTDDELCHFLKIVSVTKMAELVNSALIDRVDEDQISDVYKKCPKLSSNLRVPFKTRLNLFLSSKRKFHNTALTIKVQENMKNSMNYLGGLVHAQQNLMFSQLHATFVKGSGYMNILSLNDFFTHFLNVFLNSRYLYIQVSESPDGRPVIIPSLSSNSNLWKLVLSVLTRSPILEFAPPFIIDKFFFYSSIKYLVIKDSTNVERFYNHIYSSAGFQTYLQNVPTEKLAYIVSLLSDTGNAFVNAFAPDYVFTAREMYNLIFMFHSK